jgi:hypothetical protein
MKLGLSSKDCKGRIKDGKREIRAYFSRLRDNRRPSSSFFFLSDRGIQTARRKESPPPSTEEAILTKSNPDKPKIMQ